MANGPGTVTEAELAEQFQADPQFALQVLHSEFRENIYRYIKSVGCWLGEHEIDDVYQEMFCRLILAVRKPDFDRTQPPKQKIAARAFLVSYEQLRKNDYSALAEAIHDMTGEDVTTAVARDRWREAKTTIASKLERAGLKLLED